MCPCNCGYTLTFSVIHNVYYIYIYNLLTLFDNNDPKIKIKYLECYGCAFNGFSKFVIYKIKII